MRKISKLLAIILSITIICATLPFGTITAGAEEATEGYYTYTVTDGEATITDCDDLISGDITIPSILGGYPVTSIGDYAFEGCTGLISVTIPNSVTSIGNYAFYDCTGLTSVTIPDSVTSIGYSAFEGCTGLTSVTIGNSVTSIGDYAFGRCTGLESIEVDINNPTYHSAGNCLIETASKTLIRGCNNSIIPSDGSVTSISSYAFYYCTGLTSVTIPNSITSIGDYTFEYCTGLTSVTIPNSVTSIGYGAFSGCTEFESITVDINNPTYHSAGNCLIETVSKTLICGCKNSIIPSDGSVTSIDDVAFSGCTGLTSVTIPNSVTSIGNYAFYDCTGLTNVTIPNSITSIGDYTFEYCTGLTSVTIPDSVTSIGYGAFSGCTGLESIEVDINNPTYHSAGNCLIETASKTLIRGCNNSIIPSDGSVTSIGNYAFYDCTGLTNVTIPDSVTSIGDWAFGCCYGLETVIYKGTPEQWDEISIDYGNDELISAKRYYYNSPIESIEVINNTIVINDYELGYFPYWDGEYEKYSLDEILDMYPLQIKINYRNGDSEVVSCDSKFTRYDDVVIVLKTTGDFEPGSSNEIIISCMDQQTTTNINVIKSNFEPDALTEVIVISVPELKDQYPIDCDIDLKNVEFEAKFASGKTERFVVSSSFFIQYIKLNGYLYEFVLRDDTWSCNDEHILKMEICGLEIPIATVAGEKSIVNFELLSEPSKVEGEGADICIHFDDGTDLVTQTIQFEGMKGDPNFSGGHMLLSEGYWISWRVKLFDVGYYGFLYDPWTYGYDLDDYILTGNEINARFIAVMAACVFGADSSFSSELGTNNIDALITVATFNKLCGVDSDNDNYNISVEEMMSLVHNLFNIVNFDYNSSTYYDTQTNSFIFPGDDVMDEEIYGNMWFNTHNIYETFNYKPCVQNDNMFIYNIDDVFVQVIDGKITYVNTVPPVLDNTVSAVTIINNPTKTTYEIGEQLDTTGLTLKLTYSDGSNEVVSSGFTTSGFSSETAGTKTVTVTYEGKTANFNVTVKNNVIGDLDGNDAVTDADAVYLLMYTFFPDDYPINQDCDFDDNGAITDADAVYLLMYTFFPEDYPIVKAQAPVEPTDPGETEPHVF